MKTNNPNYTIGDFVRIHKQDGSMLCGTITGVRTNNVDHFYCVNNEWFSEFVLNFNEVIRKDKE